MKEAEKYLNTEALIETKNGVDEKITLNKSRLIAIMESFAEMKMNKNKQSGFIMLPVNQSNSTLKDQFKLVDENGQTRFTGSIAMCQWIIPALQYKP